MREERRNPYVGPTPFQRADKELFFGRTPEMQELRSLVIAYRIVVLYAMSGAGKTSLINAGLVPLLEEEEGVEVLPVAHVRGLKLDAASMSPPDNVFMFNALANWAESAGDAGELTPGITDIAAGARPSRGGGRRGGSPRPSSDLTHMSLANYLRTRPNPVGPDGLPLPRLVVFDQLEDLFSLYPAYWHHRREFFDQIAEAVRSDPNLRVILALREEYLAEFDSYRSRLPSPSVARFRLIRLRRDGGLEAVTEPARQMGRKFDADAANALVDNLMKVRVPTGSDDEPSGQTDLEGPLEAPGEFVEPVQLQVVCQSLWDDLSPDEVVIDKRHIRRFGDVDDVLARFYTKAVQAAAAAAGLNEREVRAWVEGQFITPDGKRNLVYHTRQTTAGMPNAVVDELEARRLIRAEWRSGARWYELTHDRLIGPIRRSNRITLYQPMDRDEKARQKSKAVKALALAEAAWMEFRYDDARKEQDRALRIFDALADRPARANALMRMAEMHFRADELISARRRADEARVLYEDLNDPLGVADALRAIGRVDAAQSGGKSGGRQLAEALHIYEEQGQHAGEGWTLLTMSEASHLAGREAAAVNDAERALRVFRDAGERLGTAASLIALGKLYADSARYSNALESYNLARHIYGQLADVVSAGAASAQMGYLLFDQRAYDPAFDRLTEAIRLSPDDESPYFVRGLVYSRKQLFDRAIQDFDRVLKDRADHAGARCGRALGLVVVGERRRGLGDLAQRLELTEDERIRLSARRCAALAEAGKGQEKQATSEFSVALGRFADEAFAVYRRALLRLSG